MLKSILEYQLIQFVCYFRQAVRRKTLPNSSLQKHKPSVPVKSKRVRCLVLRWPLNPLHYQRVQPLEETQSRTWALSVRPTHQCKASICTCLSVGDFSVCEKIQVNALFVFSLSSAVAEHRRSVRPSRRTKGSRNPLRALAAREDIQQDFMQSEENSEMENNTGLQLKFVTVLSSWISRGTDNFLGLAD